MNTKLYPKYSVDWILSTMPQPQQRFCKQKLSEIHNRMVIYYNTAPCGFHRLTGISCLPPGKLNRLDVYISDPQGRVVLKTTFLGLMQIPFVCDVFIWLRMNDVQLSWLSFFFWCFYQVDFWGRLLKTCSFIEADTKWTIFLRRWFQMHFLEWKCFNCDWRRQAIIWTKDGQFADASLGINELRRFRFCKTIVHIKWI